MGAQNAVLENSLRPIEQLDGIFDYHMDSKYTGSDAQQPKKNTNSVSINSGLKPVKCKDPDAEISLLQLDGTCDVTNELKSPNVATKRTRKSTKRARDNVENTENETPKSDKKSPGSEQRTIMSMLSGGSNKRYGTSRVVKTGSGNGKPARASFNTPFKPPTPQKEDVKQDTNQELNSEERVESDVNETEPKNTEEIQSTASDTVLKSVGNEEMKDSESKENKLKSCTKMNSDAVNLNKGIKTLKTTEKPKPLSRKRLSQKALKNQQSNEEVKKEVKNENDQIKTETKEENTGESFVDSTTPGSKENSAVGKKMGKTENSSKSCVLGFYM